VGREAEARTRGGRGTEESGSGEEITSGEGCHAAQWRMMIMISSEHSFMSLQYIF